MSKDFAAMSAAQIRAGIVAGEFTATEVAKAALANIEARDAEIHAFLEVTPEMALGAAAKVDAAVAAGEPVGPLAGVPVAFKDNINVAGTHTTCGSHMLENYVTPFSAACYEKLVEAGALPLGKLNLDEFAFGSSTETSYFGPTHNPWNLDCVPGGSSGGSAAAVAAGMTVLAMGSDTGGSIRQPAAFCGVVGFKPSFGTVSRFGVIANANSLDMPGPLARSVEDVAVAMNALVGKDARDCLSRDVDVDFTANLAQGVAGMKIGVVKSFLENEALTPVCHAAVEDAITKLEAAGAQIVEVELPHAKDALGAYYVIGPSEGFSNLSRFDGIRYGLTVDGTDLEDLYVRTRTAGFGRETKERIMLGSYLLSTGIYDQYFIPANQVRTLLIREYAAAFEACDAIVAPVTAGTAFRLGAVADPAEMHLCDMFTVSVNLAGNGAVSLPVGLDADGLPLGVQVIGPQFRDENVLRVAAQLERDFAFDSLAPAYRAAEGGEA